MLVVVNFSSGRSTEYLELKLDRGIVRVDVDIRRDVYLLRCHGTASAGSLPVELLQVLTVRHQAATDEIDDDIGLTDVDQHIILQHDWMLLADKDTIAHTKILNQVLALFAIILDLEVSTSMLL